MRWARLFQRYSLAKRPTLKVMNPRVGTSIIPLDLHDDLIFYQYLTDKLHSLSFEGSEIQLKKLLDHMRLRRGFTIEKMRTSVGRGQERLVLLHLKLANNAEVRRLIKLT
jgi:hypothetical protein